MEEKNKATKQEKKTYEQPQLTEWGSIEDLTKGGAGGTQDAGINGTET